MSKRRRVKLRLDDDGVIYSGILVRSLNRAFELTEDPVFSSLAGMARARHWTPLISLTSELETQLHSDVLRQYVYSQVVALVKKYPFTVDELPGFDPESAAWKKFQAAEHRCMRVNQRSALLRYGVGFAYGDIIVSMKRYIRKVLGSTPNYSRIYDLCDWGPGANVGVTGDRTNFGRKFLSEKWSVTPLALSFCTEALWRQEQFRVLLLRNGKESGIVSLDRQEFADRLGERVQLVNYNNISFVPKTFKTKRSIASEPLLNGYLQKGVDQYMRQRLAAAGIDLRDQTANQQMAMLGSCTDVDPYATIDLSSASDSMSTGLVKTLLPPDWFEFLNSIRSHRYRYKGQEQSYHKFVSMGNGFCFPLQTLIFAAVCWATAQHNALPVDFRVYGDDIIVRQSLALHVMEVLRYIGFRTNSDKTFVFGPFRESCGTDWYSGQDVRPAYLDFRFDSVVALYKFHNSTLRSDLSYWFFEPIREYVRSICPPELRFVRPYHGNADGAFTVPKDVAMSCSFVRWERSTWSWSWKEVRHTPVHDTLRDLNSPICDEVKYLAALRSTGKTKTVASIIRDRGSDPVEPRDREPLAVRRKTKASVVRKNYWGLEGHVPSLISMVSSPERDS